MTLTQILIENSKKNEYAILTKDIFIKFDEYKQEYLKKYTIYKNQDNKIAIDYATKKTLEWMYNSEKKTRFIDYEKRKNN